MSVLKTQEITGHSSVAMTMHYNHPDITDFTEVRAVQDKLFAAIGKPEQKSK
jgi:hypothetical protein